MLYDPSCALPQAFSCWQQAYAGEGRVLSDVVGVVWSLGQGPQHAVPAFFASFLVHYQGLDRRLRAITWCIMRYSGLTLRAGDFSISQVRPYGERVSIRNST